MKSEPSTTAPVAVAPSRSLARYPASPDRQDGEAQPSLDHTGENASGRPGNFPPSARPQATLVAQLIATHLGLPQTRTLRRADPDAANMTYRLTSDRTSQPVKPVRDKRT